MSARKSKSNKRSPEEQELRSLTQIFTRRGFKVRRENLSRGHSFRVKSGNCLFSGDKFIFLDRRLPPHQQISILMDYLLDLQVEIQQEDLEGLSDRTQGLLGA